MANPDATARELRSDVLGLLGLVLVLSGVYRLWGVGWTLIAAGAPLFLAYVAREVQASRRR